jgi:hypothetical protein
MSETYNKDNVEVDVAEVPLANTEKGLFTCITHSFHRRANHAYGKFALGKADETQSRRSVSIANSKPAIYK